MQIQPTLPSPVVPPPPAPPPSYETRTPEQHFEALVAELNIPRQLALAIKEQESGRRPFQSPSGDVLTSPKNARGWFQVLPETAASFKLDANDPFQNIEAGLRFIKEGLDKNQNDPDLAARYYHGGPDRAQWGPLTEEYGTSVGKRMRVLLAADGGQATPESGKRPRRPGDIYVPTAEELKRNTTPNVVASHDKPPVPPWYSPEALLQTGSDLAQGVTKGIVQTTANLGKLPHMIPGVSAGIDWLYGTPNLSDRSFEEVEKETAPTNTTQSVGKVGEQIGEYLIPSGAITRAGTTLAAKSARTLAPLVGKTARRLLPRMATEAAAGAGMAAAHGESAGEGAAFGAAVPLAAHALTPAAKWLKSTASKKVAQAFGPTKEKYKAIVKRRTPEILSRSTSSGPGAALLKGSRESILEGAEHQVDEVGQAVDDALQVHGTQPLDPTPIIDALEDAKDQFRTLVHGTPVNAPPRYVNIDNRPIRILGLLQDKLQQLGPNATVAQLVQVRRVWDKTVGYAGGFAHRASGALGLPLKEQSEEWAKREATGAIRELLGQAVPDLAAVNREFSFWKDIRDTLKQTVERTAPQGPGLGQQLVTGAARVAGAAGTPGGLGSKIGGAYLSGKIAQQVNALLTSPRVRLFDARQRWRLAEAIVNEDTSTLLRLASQIGVHLYDPEKSPRVGTPPPAPPKK